MWQTLRFPIAFALYGLCFDLATYGLRLLRAAHDSASLDRYLAGTLTLQLPRSVLTQAVLVLGAWSLGALFRFSRKLALPAAFAGVYACFTAWTMTVALAQVTLGIEPTMSLAVYTLRNAGDLWQTVRASSVRPPPILYVQLLVGTAAVALLAWRYRRSEQKQSPRSQHLRVLVLAVSFAVSLGLRLGIETDAWRELAYSLRERAASRAPVRLSPQAARKLLSSPPPVKMFARRYRPVDAIRRSQRPRPHVVILILEGVRADSINLTRSRAFTPGARVRQAGRFYVAIPHSASSLFSILTGNHAPGGPWLAPPQLKRGRTLPGILARAGYRSVFLSGGHMKFEQVDQLVANAGAGLIDRRDLQGYAKPNDGPSFVWGIPDAVVGRATARTVLAAERRSPDQPVLVVSMFTNTHAPYHNPQPDRYRRWNPATERGRYRNAIDYTLSVVDQTVRKIEASSRRGVLWVLLSDHGESFGEYGFRYHDFSPFNAEVRVPFALRLPAGMRPPAIHSGSILDVMPTLLDLLDLPHHPVHGRSLFRSDYQTALLIRPWGSDAFRAVLHGNRKWIYRRADDTLLLLDQDERSGGPVAWTPERRSFARALRALRVSNGGRLLSGTMRQRYLRGLGRK